MSEMGSKITEEDWRFAAQVLGMTVPDSEDELRRQGERIARLTEPLFKYFVRLFEGVQEVCALAGAVPDHEDYARMAAIAIIRQQLDRETDG